MGEALLSRRGGGGAKGLYAWRKSTKQATVTFVQTSYNPITLTASSSDIDLGTVDASWFVGIKCNYSWATATYAFEFMENGVFVIWTADGASHLYDGTYSYNQATKTITTNIKPSGSFGINSSATKQGSFLDFVVSDKSNAYPDSGTQGGYWYEKVVEGVPLTGILGMQKIAVDYFTPTADTYLSGITLTHSLGAVPTTVFIMPVAKSYTLPADYNSYYILFHAFNAAKFISGATQWAMVREAIVGASLKCSMITSAQHSPEIVTSTQFKADTNSGTGGSYLKAGVEYAIITAA